MSIRQEIIARMYLELCFLKEEDIVRFLEEKNIYEVKRLIKNLRFIEIENYIVNSGKGLNLTWESFKDVTIPLLVYIQQSNIGDDKIFESPELFRRKLERNGGKLEKYIAKKMRYKNLCEMSLEELAGIEEIVGIN